MDGGPQEVPTHAWLKCILGGSRMDGGWSASERTKFTCIEKARLRRRRQGAARGSVGLTAAPKCTVVERSPRVRSVAPGPMAIPIRVPAKVLLQVRVGGGGGCEPGRERTLCPSRVIPNPRRAPVGELTACRPRAICPVGACGLCPGGVGRADRLTAACAASPQTSAGKRRPCGSC